MKTGQQLQQDVMTDQEVPGIRTVENDRLTEYSCAGLT